MTGEKTGGLWEDTGRCGRFCCFTSVTMKVLNRYRKVKNNLGETVE
ncbi:hypothetical protein [uncultured Clostridium sp.]|nr:hypothetical protein [uncultured Clostridium sp.]